MPAPCTRLVPHAAHARRAAEPSSRPYSGRRAAGSSMLVGLRSEPAGQRHFITADPTGILVDVVTPIPPDEAFASGYASSGAP